MTRQATATPQQRRTVICLGDSHTRGFLGASWINLLRLQLPHLRFINAGNDGEPSSRILGRLPGLLRAHPDPAAVLILSGSNDCIAQETEDLQQYYRWWFWLSQRCSQQYALDNMKQMVQMVQEEAPKAKVIVINLPIMVEDPQHSANIRAHKYSMALCDLIHQQHPQVSMIDFQSACRQYMAQHSPTWQQAVLELQQLNTLGSQNGAQELSTAATPAGAGAPEQRSSGSSGRKLWSMNFYTVARNMMVSKGYHNLIRRRGWDEISSGHGRLLLVDEIHMNDTAARMLAGLVQPLLHSV